MPSTTGLRGTIATLAMPLALSAAIGSEEKAPSWRQKPSITDMKTGTAVVMSELLLLTPINWSMISADTSEKVVTAPPSDASKASASTILNPIESLDIGWISGPLAQVMELRQAPAEDLPNETPVRIGAVVNAARAILDLGDSKAPSPQVVARGDGGLQLVWYTPTCDLEIEVRPNRAMEIVEFDGKKTHRIPYSRDNAIAAIDRIVDSLNKLSVTA